MSTNQPKRCTICQFNSDGEPGKLCPIGAQLLRHISTVRGDSIYSIGSAQDHENYAWHVFGSPSMDQRGK